MKNRYKVLISDFDNTLVGRAHTVAPVVAEQIKALQQEGFIFTIATGRFYYGCIREVAKELKLQDPLIISGGAEIIDPKTTDVLWGRYIQKEEYQELIEYFQEKKMFFLIEAGDTLYKATDEDIRHFDTHARYDVIENLTQEAIAKIIIPAPAVLRDHSLEEVIAMEGYLTQRFPDLHIVKFAYNGGYGLDITSAKASKHIAVLEFMKMMDLHPEEVVGVGDSYNDYPLLTACGTKVAMGDAPDELKALADFIAPPQSENGILAVIEKYF